MRDPESISTQQPTPQLPTLCTGSSRIILAISYSRDVVSCLLCAIPMIVLVDTDERAKEESNLIKSYYYI